MTKASLLEDKKGIYTVQGGLHTYKRAYQHTGDSAGYIERAKGFYTLYNSGYDKSGGAIAQSCTARLTAGGSKTSFRTTSALQAF